MILQEQGENASAQSALEKTLYLDHNFALGYYSLGNLKREQKQFKDAEKLFLKALQLLENLPPDLILPNIEEMTVTQLIKLVLSNIHAGVNHESR
jgi:tetratricopeptide (TPR) repeat protein